VTWTSLTLRLWMLLKVQCILPMKHGLTVRRRAKRLSRTRGYLALKHQRIAIHEREVRYLIRLYTAQHKLGSSLHQQVPSSQDTPHV